MVNLERLRLIISSDQCIILHAPHNPVTLGMHVSPEAPFVKDLVLRLRQAKTPWCAYVISTLKNPVCHLEEGPDRMQSNSLNSCTALRDEKTKVERKQLFADLSLPYELLALESALAAYNKELDTEAVDIETLAVPCLERLAARVTL